MIDRTASDRLFADLARDAAEVIRGELVLDGLRRAPVRRLALADVAVVAAAGVALVIAAGAGTAAVVLALSNFARPAISAAVAAGLWIALALVVARSEPPRRLLRLVAPEPDEAAVAAAELELTERIEQLRATTRALARALEGELATYERDAAERLVHAAVAAVLAPARAGLDRLRL